MAGSPTSNTESGTTTGRHPVDEVLPLGRLALLRLQHVFIMYAGAVAVRFIVGNALKLDQATIDILVNADLLVAGIATFIQGVGISKLFGVRLPVVAAGAAMITGHDTEAAGYGGLSHIGLAFLASCWSSCSPGSSAASSARSPPWWH